MSIKEFIASLLSNFNPTRNTNHISCGIMVKNQEKRIVSTINGLLDCFDQIIIVDTGSNDKTITQIKSLNSNKIYFYEIPWINNFSVMRNKIIDLNNSEWLFFIDSDEYIDEKEKPSELRGMLALLDSLTKDVSLAIDIKQWSAQSASFSVIDRLLREGDILFYVGKVHEYLYSDNTNIVHLQTNFQIHNMGTLPSEVNRFDKKQNHASLTKEMLSKDPYNQHWIVLLPSPDLNSNHEEKDKYFQLLKNGLFIDPEKPMTSQDLRKTNHTHDLLTKYLLMGIARGEYSEAILESSKSLKLFPMSTILLYIHHFAKYLKLELEKSLNYDELLIDVKALDKSKAEEISHQKQDIIYSLFVHYNFDFQNYNVADQFLQRIIDRGALHNLKIERLVLKKLKTPIYREKRKITKIRIYFL